MIWKAFFAYSCTWLVVGLCCFLIQNILVWIAYGICLLASYYALFIFSRPEKNEDNFLLDAPAKLSIADYWNIFFRKK
jgi:hypothetical protein